MQTPAIQSIEIEKTGRFWSVILNRKMLALVLYKRGAIAIRDALLEIAGLPVNKPEEEPAEKPSKKPAKDSGKKAPKAAKTRSKKPKAAKKAPAQPAEGAANPKDQAPAKAS